MRYSYDWVAVLLGAILIVSSDVGRFVQDHTALYTNVVVGIVLMVWPLVSYLGREGVEGNGRRQSPA